MSEETFSDIGDVSPTSLSHLVGQRSVIQQCSVAIDAAFADNRPMDHCLLVGPPGLGKSQLASILAREMATEFHEVLGQSIQTSADLNCVLLSAEDKHVVHIDECHELRKDFQTALYLAVDQRKVLLQTGLAGKSLQPIPLCDFTLLLSTTDEYCLLQPLRDRMKLLLRFDFYSDEELILLLMQRAHSLGWAVEEEELFAYVAQRARGTPRLALRLLQSCRRVCRAQNDTVITVDHLARACQLEQIDIRGLGITEIKYLELLADGASRLNVLASMLGLPSRTVAQVIEPYLLRSGLVIKDDQGRRQLTATGRDHLSNCCENLA
ncbi:MAG: AAA family ATPase [Planctomycetota bacterium]|nr:AAA family ATPase [Planctomycetota bacterium]